MTKKPSKKSNIILTVTTIICIMICVSFCVFQLLSTSSTSSLDTTTSSPDTTTTAITFPLQIQGWEPLLIDSLCLEIKQSYPEEWFGFFKETLVNIGVNITPRQYSFPYDELIKEIMHEIGITVVNQDTQCDAVLNINVSGTASSRRYGNIITKRGNSQCYTSTSVSGRLTLTLENQETFETSFRGHVPASETVFSSNCPDQPYEAPFDDSSAGALTDALVQLWGQEIAGVIQKLYYGGYGKGEEAMGDAAKKFIRGEVTPHPTVPQAEPAHTPNP